MKTIREFFLSPAKAQEAGDSVSSATLNGDIVVQDDSNENDVVEAASGTDEPDVLLKQKPESPTKQSSAICIDDKSVDASAATSKSASGCGSEDVPEASVSNSTGSKRKNNLALKKKPAKSQDIKKSVDSGQSETTQSNDRKEPNVVSYESFLKCNGSGSTSAEMDHTNEGQEVVKEVSYADFLSTQEPNGKGDDTDDTCLKPEDIPRTETKNSVGKSNGTSGDEEPKSTHQEKQRKAPKNNTHKDVTCDIDSSDAKVTTTKNTDVEDVEDDEKQEKKPAKPIGNIMKYFSRVSSPRDRTISCSTKMKINAMIHPSPSKNGSRSHMERHSRKPSEEGMIAKSNVVANNNDLLSITHLESSMVEVSVKRRHRANKWKSLECKTVSSVSKEVTVKSKTPDMGAKCMNAGGAKDKRADKKQPPSSLKLAQASAPTETSSSGLDGEEDVVMIEEEEASMISGDKEVKDPPMEDGIPSAKEGQKQCTGSEGQEKDEEAKASVSVEVVTDSPMKQQTPPRKEDGKANASTTSSDEDVLLIDEGVTLTSPRAAAASARLQTSLNTDVTKDLKKTQQSVLQFKKKGGLGLGLAPQPPKPPPSSETDGSVEEDSKGKPEPKKKRESKENKGNASTTKLPAPRRNTRAKQPPVECEKVKESPVKTAKRKKKANVIESSDEDEPMQISEEETFKVAVTKSKPLVMRFTRLRSQTVKTEEEQVKQVKLSRAQRLLQKARGKKKPMPKTESPAAKPAKKQASKKFESVSSSSDFTSPPARRSSRNCAKVASLAISMCYEGNSTGVTQAEHTPRKRERKKSDPPAAPIPVTTPASSRKTQKRSPRKPAKSAVKLAPIFSKAGKKSEAAPSPQKLPPPPLTAAELEMQRVRRLFLTSGLPQVVQRQQLADAIAATADYPPIPAVSHVLQRPPPGGTGLDIWQLPNVNLNLKPQEEEKVTTPICCLGELTQSQVKATQFEGRVPSEPTTLDGEVEQLLLAEILTNNPAYPVRKTYRQLNKHNKEVEQCDQPAPSESADATKPGKGPGSKKRKLAEVQADPDARPERTKRLRRSRRSASTSKDSQSTDTPGGEASEEKSPTVVEETASEKQKSASDGDSKRDLLWTEKYQPQQATEVLGNSGVVRKMKGWLVEWKHRLDAEMKRQRKLQLKQAKREGKSLEEIRKKLGLDLWADDDSDFALSDVDEDSDGGEDDSLCNTVLLTGPSGCGKTATVYALAKELGYKVFEVNASSKRSGRQILAQLQEATQSHQVSKKKIDPLGTPTNSPFLANQSAKPMATKAVEKKPLPAAFANLFNKKPAAETSQKRAKSKKDISPKPEDGKKGGTKGKKRRRSSGDVVFLKEEHTPVKKQPPKSRKKEAVPDKPTETVTATQKGLDLCSMSLILFEDVDVVFEEDKGFWAAIDTFMQSTKVPIVVTTNDRHFLDHVRFSGRMEQYNMRMPHLTSLAAHLQLVCLTEKLRTKFLDLLSLAEYCHGDMRQSLLTLQYIMESGGSGQLIQQPVTYSAKFLKTDSANPSTVVESGIAPKVADLISESQTKSILPTFGTNVVDDANSEDEFMLHTKRRPLQRRARPVIWDESSVDSVSMTPRKSQPPSLQTIDSQTEDNCASSQQSVDGRMDAATETGDLVSVENSETRSIPCAQHALFENATCVMTLLRKRGCCASVSKTLDLEKHPASTLAALFKHYRGLGQDILYANFPFLLPLPHTDQPPPPCEPLRSAKARWSRIQCRSDFFEDSDDDSDSKFLSIPKKSVENEAAETVTAEAAKPPREPATAADRVVQSALDSISDLYSDLSLLDTMRCGDQQQLQQHLDGKLTQVEHQWRGGNLTAGLGDALGTSSGPDFQDVMLDVISTAQAHSLGLHTGKLRSTVGQADGLDPAEQQKAVDGLTVYVGTEQDRVHLDRDSASEQRLAAQRSRAVSNVCTQLPGSVQSQRQAVVLDYIPGIRTICQLEECRKAYSNKRRFFHHLNSMMFGLKTSSIDTLCSSFK